MATIPQIEKDARVTKKTPETPETTPIEPNVGQNQDMLAPPTNAFELAQNAQRTGTLTDREKQGIIDSGKQIGVEATREKLMQAPVEPIAKVEAPQVPTQMPVSGDQSLRELPKGDNTPKAPIQTAQQIKAEELANKSSEMAVKTQEDQVKAQDKQVKLTEFQNILNAGADIQEIAQYAQKNPQFTGDYKIALSNYLKLDSQQKYARKYANMSTEGLVGAVKNGDIVINGENYDLIPENKRAELEQNMKFELAQTNKIDFESPQYKMDLSFESFMSKMFDNSSRTQIEALQNDNRLVETSQKYNAKKAEVQKIDQDIENIRDDVLKQYPRLAPALQNAKIADAQNALIRQRNSKALELQNIQGDLSVIQADIDRKIALIEYDDAQEKKKYEFMYNEYQYQRNKMDATQLAQFEAKNQELAEQKAQEYKKEILKIQQDYDTANVKPQYMTDKNGNLLAIVDGQATNVMNSSGEVVAITKEKDHTDTSVWNSDIGMMVTTRSYNDDRMPEFFTSDINGKSSSNIAVFDKISKIGGKVGKYDLGGGKKQGIYYCGEGANYYLEANGISDIRMEDSYESKANYINNSYPQIGGLAVWNPSENTKYAENGHVGIVTGFNPQTNEVEITDWNSQRDGKAPGERHTYKIPVSQIVNSDGGFVHLKGQGNGEFDTTSEAYKQAKTIMSGTGTLSGLSVKMREEVAPIIEALKKEALAEGGIIGEMKASAGGKESTDSFRNSFEKGVSVISQIGNLGDQLFTKGGTIKDEEGDDIDLSPLTGWLRSKNPWDTDAATIQASLTAIVPNLARGIYGEVGVLTNQDVELYKKTIPNLTQTEDVQKAVMALTMKTVRNSLDNKIRINAATGVNMAGLVPFYEEIDAKVKELEASIGINQDTTQETPQATGGQSTMSGVLDLNKLTEMYKSTYTEAVTKYNYLD